MLVKKKWVDILVKKNLYILGSIPNPRMIMICEFGSGGRGEDIIKKNYSLCWKRLTFSYEPEMLVTKWTLQLEIFYNEVENETDKVKKFWMLDFSFSVR